MDSAPLEPAERPDPDGSQIEQMARDAIGAHPQFFHRRDRFEFTFREGILEIHGTADSFYMKQVLQTAIQGVLNGICRINNQVAVVSKHHSNGATPGQHTRAISPRRPTSND